MNIFHKLTRRSLSKNRTRTLVTIIGIILSAAMFMGVATIITSMTSFMTKSTVAVTGNWHGAFFSATQEQLDALAESDDIAPGSIKSAQVLGYAEYDGIQNNYKPYLFVLGGEEGFFDDMGIYLTDGRLPETPGEIIIPGHLMQNGGLALKTGDSITVNLGDRLDADGSPLLQTKGLLTDDNGEAIESVSFRESRTYTVVGHYNRADWEDYSAPGYTVLTVADEDTDSYLHDIYFRVTNPKDAFNYMSGAGIGMDWKSNGDLLMTLGSSAYDGFYTFVCGFAAILIVLIMFGSISLIYNAFSISVSERTKQFGLLSSVGATKKQIRSSVNYEALLVSIIGIPLGILAGIAGIGVTLFFIGDMFADIFSGSSAANVSLTLSVSPYAILFSVVISLVTIFISVRIPARRATKVTAIDAIRQAQDVKIKGKKVRTSRLTGKLFGLEGTLASKNFKRSKRSYRSTVVSLFMSIVLFVSASSFCYYLTGSVDGASGAADYDIRYHYQSNEEDGGSSSANDILQMLSEADGVTEYASYTVAAGQFSYDKQELSRELQELFDENEYAEASFMTVYVNVVDDDSYGRYLDENGLDRSVYMNSENPVFIGNQTLSYMQGTSKIRNFDIWTGDNGRTLDISVRNMDKDAAYDEIRSQNEEYEEYDYDSVLDDFEIDIALMRDKLVLGISNTVGYGLNVMISESCAKEVFGDLSLYFGSSKQFVFTASDHEKAYDDMSGILSQNGLPPSMLYDYAGSEGTMRNLVTIINVLAYGFIILISLISIANVFNTISTNIALRRREFAMLKSVGMTSGGFNRMMNYECLLYGLKALIYGLPVSVLVTFAIWVVATGSFEQSFVMPVMPVVIAVVSVFFVVFVTMLYSMRKIKKDNPIEALKLETL